MSPICSSMLLQLHFKLYVFKFYISANNMIRYVAKILNLLYKRDTAKHFHLTDFYRIDTTNGRNQQIVNLWWNVKFVFYDKQFPLNGHTF